MGQTSNYDLILTDDASTYFKNWREIINGVSDSNMIKIDKVLGDKADSSIAIESTLLAANWVGTEAPYTQELEIDGLLATHNGDISVSQSATTEQRNAARYAMITVTGQSDGVLTISADGDVPTVDIPVVIILID